MVNSISSQSYSQVRRFAEITVEREFMSLYMELTMHQIELFNLIKEEEGKDKPDHDYIQFLGNLKEISYQKSLVLKADQTLTVEALIEFMS